MEEGVLSIYSTLYTYMLTPTWPLKGMFQNPLIMYTLAHAHFIEYGNDLPEISKLQNDMKPVGTLILSLQAVNVSHLNFTASDIFLVGQT